MFQRCCGQRLSGRPQLNPKNNSSFSNTDQFISVVGSMCFSKGTDGTVKQSPGFLGESPMLDPFSHHDLFTIPTVIRSRSNVIYAAG